MAASIKFDESTFTVSNKPQFRAQPDVEFEHRLKTREHLTFLRDNKLFDVRDSRWAKKTIKGEVIYAHEYMDCLLVVRLTTADNTMNLTHNEDGSLDRRLMDDPGEKVVYSITSENNGIESNHFFKSSTIGLSSVAIICAALAMTVSLANGLVAAEAALAAGAEVATIFGLETTVFRASASHSRCSRSSASGSRTRLAARLW